MQTDLFIDIVKGFDSAHGADHKPEQKVGQIEVPSYAQDETLVNLNDNKLWDSYWLREKYPNRYDSHYHAEWDMVNERQDNYEKMYGTGKK